METKRKIYSNESEPMYSLQINSTPYISWLAFIFPRIIRFGMQKQKPTTLSALIKIEMTESMVESVICVVVVVAVVVISPFPLPMQPDE